MKIKEMFTGSTPRWIVEDEWTPEKHTKMINNRRKWLRSRCFRALVWLSYFPLVILYLPVVSTIIWFLFGWTTAFVLKFMFWARKEDKKNLEEISELGKTENEFEDIQDRFQSAVKTAQEAGDKEGFLSALETFVEEVTQQKRDLEAEAEEAGCPIDPETIRQGDAVVEEARAQLKSLKSDLPKPVLN